MIVVAIVLAVLECLSLLFTLLVTPVAACSTKSAPGFETTECEDQFDDVVIIEIIFRYAVLSALFLCVQDKQSFF